MILIHPDVWKDLVATGAIVEAEPGVCKPPYPIPLGSVPYQVSQLAIARNDAGEWVPSIIEIDDPKETIAGYTKDQWQQLWNAIEDKQPPLYPMPELDIDPTGLNRRFTRPLFPSTKPSIPIERDDDDDRS